jgi:hypothetical protein
MGTILGTFTGYSNYGVEYLVAAFNMIAGITVAVFFTPTLFFYAYITPLDGHI